MNKKLLNLNSFLKFGYFLDYQNPKYSINFKLANPQKYSNLQEDELLKLFGDKFKKAIINQYATTKKNCVPLSGGLDSRAILAVLLELTEASNINTYTFGTPETYDYELGCEIAKKYGTNHEKIPIDRHIFSIDELIATSKRFNYQTHLFFHPPLSRIDELFGDNVIWSGAVIDVFFGRHHHKKKATTLSKAIENSFDENLFVKSCDLANLSYVDMAALVDYDASTDGVYSYEHVIDLLNRQSKYIMPHVLYNDLEFKVLFTDDDLVEFALSIDQGLNEGQYIYKKMLLKEFPGMFMTGYKSNYGLPLDANPLKLKIYHIMTAMKRNVNKLSSVFIDKYINYYSFKERLDDDSIFAKLVYDNVSDLIQRKIVDWIDLSSLVTKHKNKENDYSDALMVLASLEIHLKAGKVL